MLSADLSAEILQPQENGMIYSKGWKEKEKNKTHSWILCPRRLPFRTEKEIGVSETKVKGVYQY